MKLIRPHVELLHITPNAIQLIEQAGRTCYKSEDKITKDSAEKFIKMLMQRGHLSVLEHATATVKFVCDRGVTHELVRHRIASYSQESTRYCNYKGGVTFVIPPWVELPDGEYEIRNEYHRWFCNNEPLKGYDDELSNRWLHAMRNADAEYRALLRRGWTPQQARGVLPNSLKTEIVTTMNFREWLYVLNLRTSPAAHPQMVEVMEMVKVVLGGACPVVFGQ